MNWNGLFSMLSSKFFWKNIGVAFLVLTVVLLTVFISLSFLTRHGEKIVVPNVIGMYEEEASVVLSRIGVVGNVIDSVYIRGRRPGEIVEQNPSEGFPVKHGRHIYLTINSRTPYMIPVPDLKDASFRQAKATLEAVGFVIKSVQYVPSEFEGLLRDIRFEGKSVQSGTRLCDGSELVLVVGEGNSSESGRVPFLKELSFSAAIDLIKNSGFEVGSVMFDVAPVNQVDKSTYFVYRQDPESEIRIPIGKRIDIWLTQDPKKLESSADKNPMEEEFF